MSNTNAPYANEYIFIFTLSEQPDGTYKIKALEEFLDSMVVSTFVPAEMKRQQEVRERGENISR